MFYKISIREIKKNSKGSIWKTICAFNFFSLYSYSKISVSKNGMIKLGESVVGGRWVAGSVEHLTVGRWLVFGGLWVNGAGAGGSVVGGFVICLF